MLTGNTPVRSASRRHRADARLREVCGGSLRTSRSRTACSPDRPADVAAALVPLRDRPSAGRWFRVPRDRRQRRVAVVVPRRSVDALVPDLIDTLMTAPAERPNSAEKLLVWTLNCSIASGIRLHDLRRERLRVLRALVVVEAVEHEVVLRLRVAVDDEPAGAARVERHRAGRRARHEQRELGVAAAGERQLDRDRCPGSPGRASLPRFAACGCAGGHLAPSPDVAAASSVTRRNLRSLTSITRQRPPRCGSPDSATQHAVGAARHRGGS